MATCTATTATAVTGLLTLLALAACSSTGPADPVAPAEQTGQTGPAGAPALAGCGSVPASTGPAASTATISLHAPASAARGSTIPVTSTLRASADGYRIITQPAASEVLVLAGGQVVGRAGNHGRGLLPVPVPLRSGALRPLQAIPDTVRLVGCPVPGQPVQPGRPGQPVGADLPAGRYTLVAVLGYTVDALTSADSAAGMTATPATFTLVSEPLPLTVG